MTAHAHLLFAAAASLGYSFAVLLSKRAADLGAGIWRPTLAANLASAIAFTPLLLLGGQVPSAGLLWQPGLVAMLFLVGQLCTYWALQKGDVSVATPVMGLKVPFVAFLSTVVAAQAVAPKLWLAAGLCTLAIALLNRAAPGDRGRLWQTVAASASAALAFALFDVLVQQWSPAWGTGRFLPIMFWLVALWSLCLTPLWRESLRSTPPRARAPLAGGAAAMAGQAVCLVSALSWFGDATAMNIVYSSRALWSVVAVWAVGHWFHNAEQQLGPAVLRRRLVGAAVMMGAIVLVVTR